MCEAKLMRHPKLKIETGRRMMKHRRTIALVQNIKKMLFALKLTNTLKLGSIMLLGHIITGTSTIAERILVGNS